MASTEEDVVSASPSSSSPTSASYAFLNHSTDTLHDNLPPRVDDQPLARQRRKRTSPEDAALLEAAYLRDPKPDKPARLALVKQVALGEKEVQIWFQNRRQTSRRKSRPLLPFEIAQYQTNRSGTSSSGGLSSTLGLSSWDAQASTSETHLQRDHYMSQTEGTDRSHTGMDEPCSACSPSPMMIRQSHNSQQDTAPASAQRSDLAAPSHPTTASASLASVGFLSNRRRAPPLRQSFPNKTMLAPPLPTVASGRRLQKSSSFARLSMNAEGKAEVVTKDASSPSPPHSQQVLLTEISGSTAPNLMRPIPSNLQRSSSGRSRDSRAWEFWCDKEARLQLGTAAEKNASGSAAGAIGLLRTASRRNVLGAVPSKRNSILHTQQSCGKRSKLGDGRNYLRRSSTSMGRLQGAKYTSSQAMPDLKHSGSATSVRRNGTDSDKENWSPDSEMGSGYPPAEGQQRNPGSAHSLDVPTTTAEADPENDEELAAFMREGRKSSAFSGDDDLDCVQGLLSLSQGNWQ